MGLTQKLGTIPLAIFTDSSNNIGIGGTPSGSYKFEVTGSGRFTGNIYGNGLLYLKNGAGASGGIQQAYGASTDSRTWWISNDVNQYGDFAIQSSTTQTGTTFATRLAILNNGNVGIGTSSPGYRLHSVGAGSGSGWSVLLENNNKISVYAAHADGYGMALDSAANGSEYVFKAAGGDGTNKGTNEWFKVFANGETRIAGISGSSQTNFSIYDGGSRRVFCIPSQYYGYIFAVSVASNGGKAISIGNAGGSSEVGSIVANASSTTYNTSSDYRLKEDLKDFEGLDILSKIKFYDFKWKSEDARSTGVIAHELQEIVPYAVNGEKDAIGKDDNPSYQGVDYSKLVAIMGKAIQELSAKVSALENKS
jgi:hypothetical protein